MEPEGKVIVVTGAAGGIGGALVRALHARGARTVVAADLDATGIERLSEDLGGERVLARELDVCDEAATRALVEMTKSIVPRCLTPRQLQRFHLAPEAPRWCYTIQLWPYDDPAKQLGIRLLDARSSRPAAPE